MAGTLINKITKHKYSSGPSDEGGDRLKVMTGLITLKNAVADLAAQGVTAIDSPIITGLPDLAGYEVGDYVKVSLGFPSATAAYKILAKTDVVVADDATLTLDTDATSVQTAAVVSQADLQVLDLSEDFPTLEGIVMNPNGGYVFDYDYTNKKFIAYAMTTTPADKDPLVAVTAKDLGVLTIHYMAWGY